MVHSPFCLQGCQGLLVCLHCATPLTILPFSSLLKVPVMRGPPRWHLPCNVTWSHIPDIRVGTSLRPHSPANCPYPKVTPWVVDLASELILVLMPLPLDSCVTFFFFVGLGFEFRALHLQNRCLSHTSSPFCPGYFGDGVLQTLCLGWPCTIFPISASQVARITGVSYWHPAWKF
jgi:hypothetical protein